MKSVLVNVKAIDWDTEDYGEYDDGYEEVLELPDELYEQEVCLEDYDKDTPLSEIDEGELEEVLMDGLTEEYGFCINFIEWEYVKHRVIKQKPEDGGKYLVDDCEADKIITDENDKALTFDTWEEAKEYIDTLEGLMSKE